jgi:protocatechuate 3,4-dioxygenase, beta subunit
MHTPLAHTHRRHVLKTVTGLAASVALPAFASSRRALPAITEGPFYPPLSYRARSLDWDADLTLVQGRSDDASVTRASGELLDLFGVVSDVDGRIVDAATVEIWQCDVFGSYRHPRGAGSQVDAAFQGFGSSKTNAQGACRFRTIRPAPYPGRAPHIHVKLRHASFGELTTQLFVAGDAGNARDFLYRSLSAEERALVDMPLRAAPSDAGVKWLVQQALIVGA